MKQARGYRIVPFSTNRRMAAASASVCKEHNTIHGLAEVDITEPRRLMSEHLERTGEKLSLTSYVVTCLSRAIAEHPHLNAFRRLGKLVLLDDVTIGALVEREIDDEKIPEPLGISAAQTKSLKQIHDEIRAAQQHDDDGLGGLSGTRWVRFIPSFLFRLFIRLASKSTYMVKRFGAVSVTAVGMFGGDTQWFIPLSASTVTITIGGIVPRPMLLEGQLVEREHLCLTASFDHDIVDGAPAARFMRRFSELVRSGELLRDQ